MIIKDKGKVIPGAVIRMSLVHNHAKRITDHYVRAIEKHPYFCDWVGPKETESDIKSYMTRQLEWCRNSIKANIERGTLCWDDLLNYEMWEVNEALASGDKAGVVKHLYEMIAKILRTIDVFEGRQKLGKPETKGETK